MCRTRMLIIGLSASVIFNACTSPDRRREESLVKAEAAIATGDLDRAVEILRVAQGFDPHDQLIVTRLVQIYEESGDYGTALGLMNGFPEEVLEAPWLNLRARLLLLCGRVSVGGRLAASLAQKGGAEDETLQTLSDTVVRHQLGAEFTGDLPEAWVRSLAERLVDAGEIAAAVSWLEQLPPVTELETDPLAQQLVEASLEADDRNLVRRIDNLIADPGSPLKLLVHRRALVLAGRTAEVAQLDARFLASFPNDPRSGDSLASEARRHLARGNYALALVYADRALALDGSKVEVLILRGLALEWSGKSEEGHAALRTALALEPGNPAAREALRSVRSPEALIMRIESSTP